MADKKAEYLSVLGGLLAIFGGISSLFLGKALATLLFGVSFPIADLTIFGIIGLIGGLLVFLGLYRKDWRSVVLGGVLGLFAPCVLSVLAIIGGFLMKE